MKTVHQPVADFFLTGTPLADPRLLFTPPMAKPASNSSTEAATADAYARVASWQVMNGAFNINSTSVAAWKAMLDPIHDPSPICNKID